MLKNIKALYGCKLAATDGEIGQVKDFYFDDQAWAIRYLVVDTGSWLTDRLVLLSPHAIGSLDQDGKTLQVNLKRKKIEDSPSTDRHRPVSRQYEEDFYRFYGWSNYWQGREMWGATGFPVAMPPLEQETIQHHGHNQRDDVHLRSTKALEGYHIQATDGEIGSVSGFMVNDKSWAVSELIVDTGHWFSGQEIVIPRGKIDRISYEDSKIYVSLTMAKIKHAADYGLAKAGD